VVALGLAACGSSGSTTTTTGAGSTTSSTGIPNPSSSTTSTSAPGISMCRTASLIVTLGSPNGSAGATHYGLTFQNTGTSACTMNGYPGVSFLDTSGNQIGDPSQRQGGSTPTVTVSSGGSAYASIAVTDPGIPPCTGSSKAAQVRIYPPGETNSTQVTAPSGLLVCSSPNTSAYSSSFVTPVSASAI